MHNPYDHMEAPAKLGIIGFIGSQYISMVSLDSHYSCCQSFSAPNGKGTIHAMDATMLPRVASSSGLCMAWISIVWEESSACDCLTMPKNGYQAPYLHVI